MIVKPFEKREADVAELRRLAGMPHIDDRTRAAIEREIRAILAGDAAEAEAAYEIDFHFGGQSKGNHVVLHGLRLDVNGRVAQIDHMLINRFLDCYVIESKSFSGGIAINEHGEFTTFFNNKPVAVPSPVTQNDRHIAVLKEAEKLGLFANPRRLGVVLPMTLKPVIAVGSRSRISRPTKAIRGIERLIKTDQFKEMYDRDTDRASPLEMVKLISADSLAELGRSIARRHQPIVFDWAGKFGVAAEPEALVAVPPPRPAAAPSSLPDGGPQAAADAPALTRPAKAKAAQCCAVCGIEVENKVVWFCRMNKARFDGRILCRAHQALV
jgi:hypothetical protein